MRINADDKQLAMRIFVLQKLMFLKQVRKSVRRPASRLHVLTLQRGPRSSRLARLGVGLTGVAYTATLASLTTLVCVMRRPCPFPNVRLHCLIPDLILPQLSRMQSF